MLESPGFDREIIPWARQLGRQRVLKYMYVCTMNMYDNHVCTTITREITVFFREARPESAGSLKKQRPRHHYFLFSVMQVMTSPALVVTSARVTTLSK